MFTDCIDKVRLTPSEKAYIAAHLDDWQSEPEGDYWTDNGRMNVTFSYGITIYESTVEIEGKRVVYELEITEREIKES